MLTEATNKVKIEGILSEVDINPISYKKNGADTEALSGLIKVRVEGQIINGQSTTVEVPVHYFVNKFKNDGTPNPCYTNLEQAIATYKSISAVGVENADMVRITTAKISMNEFYPEGSDTLVSYPRITSSFLSKVTNRETFKPTASFEATFVVANGADEVDANGTETGRYKITGILPQYGGKVDVVPFYAVNDGVINAISNYWNPNDTVRAIGKLNFSSTTVTETVEVDFGDPEERTKTVSVSELIITGGSEAPLDGDAAYDINDINAALADRKAKLLERKNAGTTKGPSKAAVPPKGKVSVSDLGF